MNKIKQFPGCVNSGRYNANMHLLPKVYEELNRHKKLAAQLRELYAADVLDVLTIRAVESALEESIEKIRAFGGRVCV